MINQLKADIVKSGWVADKKLEELDKETKEVLKDNKKQKKIRNMNNKTTKQKIVDDSDDKKLTKEEYESNESENWQKLLFEWIEKERQNDDNSNQND